MVSDRVDHFAGNRANAANGERAFLDLGQPGICHQVRGNRVLLCFLLNLHELVLVLHLQTNLLLAFPGPGIEYFFPISAFLCVQGAGLVPSQSRMPALSSHFTLTHLQIVSYHQNLFDVLAGIPDSEHFVS